ncbi:MULTISPECIES: hypothetical protein [Streptomyces]|uniref:DUF4303 domain-containing protein n=2 Tax=Streptomyces TaxID=1883 RepID=A0ABV9IYH2_9ACTN
MNEIQERLDLLAGELGKRDVAYSHVADSSGPEVAISWRHYRLMIAWESTDNGYDWQFLDEDGQVCSGSWREESVEQIADTIQAMVKEVFSFDRQDAHLHTVLLAAGVSAIYEHTGGGCHNVEILLTDDRYIIFGTEGGDEAPVGWSLLDDDFNVLDESTQTMSPEDVVPHIKKVIASVAHGS